MSDAETKNTENLFLLAKLIHKFITHNHDRGTILCLINCYVPPRGSARPYSPEIEAKNSLSTLELRTRSVDDVAGDTVGVGAPVRRTVNAKLSG